MLILIHYSEIALKKGNRKFFEQKLKNNILKALKKYKPKACKSFGNILIELTDIKYINKEKVFNNEVIHIIRRIFGISNFALVFNKLNEFSDNKASSFKVQTVRSDKNFFLTSQDINEKLGKILQKKLNIKVKLKNPDLTIFVEIPQKSKKVNNNNNVLFYFNKHQGTGGLPLETSGNVIGMLSGGIDSPVACFKIMRRGAKIIFLHFHSYPYTNKTSQKIAIKLAEKLALWNCARKIYNASF